MNAIPPIARTLALLLTGLWASLAGAKAITPTNRSP